LEGERAAAKSQENTVFISYAREDSNAAKRLRKDLKDTGLNPWLDKEELLPGQNWENEIKNAISKSRYFIALFSKTSVKKIGYYQNEIKFALEVLKSYPPNRIFYIPVRLEDCEIPYNEIKSIHRADLFPVDDENVWKDGVKRILRAMDVVISESDKEDFKTTGFVSPVEAPILSEDMTTMDAVDDLFWSRLCEIHRLGRIIDFPVDGITEPLDHARGYLGIGALEKPEAEKRLRRFEDEGLIKINGTIYRLTPQGKQHCQLYRRIR
jgi:TIR domain